jgi:hypothetical protein
VQGTNEASDNEEESIDSSEDEEQEMDALLDENEL